MVPETDSIRLARLTSRIDLLIRDLDKFLEQRPVEGAESGGESGADSTGKTNGPVPNERIYTGES